MFSFDPMKSDVAKLIEVFGSDVATIRTGRAKPSLVENVMVDAYGGKMRMMEVANISAPDSTMIVIKPWDQSLLSTVEKAIQISDLHINPIIDGQQVRISIPPLTGERREELVKLLNQKLHAHEDMARDIRIKYKKQIDAQKGQPGVSEDDIKRDLETLQKVTDDAIAKLGEVANGKEKELREL
ncbi:ribosome recycling factor [Candidatus Cerribacteria bacterium 'Amazon FNV 2010 28 9']|uniref:Ribosome recycling factor n=1 Tax=Candidatus Cerribacteria bacterium 'Amazon FNV 2010 28 9' TaxID=2081795 RepID=A0A317JPW8_9BACT|nr:MAG: ribosome recycling factor [Candidatus Cerribacteria bacterium 'Amazon FNV 2010 28 9']